VSIETDRPVVSRHAKKISLDDVGPDHGTQPEAGRPGWIEMDVRWLITRQTVAAEDSVFGVTYFPPGSRHEIHRHKNAEEVEYLIQGQGVARVGEDDVAMTVGEAVFVPRNDGIGVDVAIECAGNARALADCIAATRRAGTVVQTGLHVGPAEVHPMLWAQNDLTIVGTWCYRVYDWQRIGMLIGSGAFPVERVVSNRIELDATVPEGFDVLIDPAGSALKILVGVG
jgi:quercetin dioxygenase-like cupin family protein